MGNFVLDPNDFEKALSKVCRGVLIDSPKKPTFKGCLGPGKRVFLLNLTQKQIESISPLIESSGSKITNIRKETLSCVVTSRLNLNSGRADLFKFLGVPLFAIENLR